MAVLDLRWLLFGLLAVWGVAFVAAPWLGRRLRTRGQPAIAAWGDVGRGLERAPIGLLLLAEGGVYRYANPYAREVLGLAAETGRLPEVGWSYLLQADCQAARQAGASAGRYRSVALRAGEGAEVSETPSVPPTTTRNVRWWVIPLEEADLVCLLDVTTQQRAEEAARTLVNDLSHELRTPLATILTHLEVLGLPNLPPETARQSLALLKAEGQRMARLVNQMLELGRLETSAEIERRPLDLLALAEEAVAQVAPLAQERQIALSLEADTPLPLCLGDADRLRQVFLNLLDNAVKYLRPGDRVIVSLTRQAAGVRCDVRDTGPGIPVQHLPHLTRRFYRAGPQGVEGSGLGLALAAEILRRHGSRLEIESQAEGTDTGTTVRFVLAA